MYEVLALVLLLLVIAHFIFKGKKNKEEGLLDGIDKRYVKITKSAEGEIFSSFSLTFLDSSTKTPFYIVVDVETSGVYKYRNPDRKNLSNWPRIVQIAWSVFDKEGGLIKDVGEYFIQPRPIPIEAIARHGITDDECEEKGVDPEPILREFLSDCEKASFLVGHNIKFDYEVIEANMRRFNVSNHFYMPTICTMHSTTELLQIPGVVRGTLYKYPSLDELVRYLFYGKGVYPDRRSHDAEYDVAYTARCFFELKERGVIKK